MEKKRLGLYVHIPFCKRKCYYCDFISYDNCINKEDEYIESLLLEIEKRKDKENYFVDTIYFGGGTPSIIKPESIKKILDKIYNSFDIQSTAEVTLEANPGTVNREKLEKYLSYGINRLSIGLQSTDNNILKTIGRIHTYEEFLDTYNQALEVGFNNINVDLMLALPFQSMEILTDSLNKVIDLAPKHISLYSLILEVGTPLCNKVMNKELTLPDEEIERKMYWTTKKILEENGYIHYEISNFAKEGFYSNHNTNCWKQEEYMGFGVAAHSFVKGERFSNSEDLEEYINENIVTLNEELSKEELEKESIILSLRMIKGLDIKEFNLKYSVDFEEKYKDIIRKLKEEKLVEIDDGRFHLSEKGLDFANLVVEEFI